jgi:hypothetical protein
MTGKRIECKCSNGHKVFQFGVEVVNDEYVYVDLCQDCYATIKGVVLQDIINEAIKSGLPQL